MEVWKFVPEAQNVVVLALEAEFKALRTIQAPQHLQFDQATGRYEVSSAAFKMQSDGSISVDLEQLLLANGHDAVAFYPRVARAVALVAHRVGRLEAEGATVSHVPIPLNPYHGEVRASFCRKVRRALASSCEILSAIDVALAQSYSGSGSQ